MDDAAAATSGHEVTLRMEGDFPSGPVAKTTTLPKQGAWVRIPDQGIRSNILQLKEPACLTKELAPPN